MRFPYRVSHYSFLDGCSRRKEHRLMQQSLADQANFHVSMIRDYETDTGEPTSEAHRRLVVALSVCAHALIFHTNGQITGHATLHTQFGAAQLSASKILMVFIEGVHIWVQYVRAAHRLPQAV